MVRSIDPTTYCMLAAVFSVEGVTLFHSSGQQLDPNNHRFLPSRGAPILTDVIRDLSLRFLDNRGTPDPLFLLIALARISETCDWAARLNDVGPCRRTRRCPGPGADPLSGADRAIGPVHRDIPPAVADLPSVSRFKQAAARA